METEYYFGTDIDFSDNNELEKCMKHFSNNRNTTTLNFQDFKDLILNLFTTGTKNKSYDVPEILLIQLFATFDRNCDGEIDTAEFRFVWNDFIRPLVQPVTALLIIDVQNDFIDGSLALKNCAAKQDGKDVIPVINNLLEKVKFDVVVYTIDYHPKNHISFVENIKMYYQLSDKTKDVDKIAVFDTIHFEEPTKMDQKLWPTHCVEDTWGCELHEDLDQRKDSLFIYKGTNPNIDSYSAFYDNMKTSSTVLHKQLKERNVTHVIVAGLAFDYCVAYTALDAIELGYVTSVILDATRGTDNNNINTVKDKLISMNCVLTNSQEVENLISGKNPKVEFASIFLNTIKKV